jgi:FAD/FMN-containing dehydrogenase
MPPSQDDVILLSMTTRGGVVLPVSPKYDMLVRQQHNACFHDRKPAFFVECLDTADVVEAVKFAAKHEMPISVRSGGHGAEGSSLKGAPLFRSPVFASLFSHTYPLLLMFSHLFPSLDSKKNTEGTMVIDLQIEHIEFEDGSDIIKMGPTATLHSLNVETLRKGRSLPYGIAPPTGCGGLLLHGGVGFLQHKYGASVDSIEGLTVVLADGSVKRVDRKSEGEDRDLFFALRGAAGQIGIVTEIEMRSYPMEMVTGGLWIMADDKDYTKSIALMKKARDMVIEQEKAGKRELFGEILFGNAPPSPDLPVEAHGAPVTIVWLGMWGTDEGHIETLKQFMDRDTVMGKPPSVMPFNIFNQLLVPMMMTVPAQGAYFKGEFIDYEKLKDSHIDDVAKIWSAKEMPTFGGSLSGIELHGGKAGAEHGAKLNEGNDHCVPAIRGFGVAIPILMWFPVDSEGKNFDKGRSLARSVSEVFDGSRGPATYSNYFNGASKEDSSVEALLKGSITDPARVKAVKARVDPKNMFERRTIMLE